MQACRSDYSYTTLVSNYIEYNTSGNTEPLHQRYTSTANGRLSFEGPYLSSYSTRVAKVIHTKRNTYLLVNTASYTNTTAGHLSTLSNCTSASIVRLSTVSLTATFKEVVDEHLTHISSAYLRCRKARNGDIIQAGINSHVSVIRSVLPELHHQTRAAIERKLTILPVVPDKLNKFTRPALLFVLKERNLI